MVVVKILTSNLTYFIDLKIKISSLILSWLIFLEFSVEIIQNKDVINDNNIVSQLDNIYYVFDPVCGCI